MATYQPTGGVHTISTNITTASNSFLQTVELTNGNFFVDWGTGDQVFDANGNPVAAAINSSSPLPLDLALAPLNNGSIVFTFLPSTQNTIDGAIIPDPTVGVGFTGPIFPPSASVFFGYPAVTELSGGGFAMAWWESNNAGQQLLVQSFNNSAVAISSQTGISPASDYQPAITQLTNGDLALAWTSLIVSNNPIVHIGVLNQSGSLIGSQSETGIVQGEGSGPLPALAALPNGNFVAVWNDGQGDPIQGQIFDPNAEMIGSQFSAGTGAEAAVNTVSGGAGPHVTALTNGDFVVSWVNSLAQAYLQVFDESGHALGSEIALPGSVGPVSVAALPNADFAAVWQGLNNGHIVDFSQIYSLQPNPSPPIGTTAVMIMTQASAGNYEIYDIGNNAVLAAYPLTNATSPWEAADVGGFNGSDTSDLLLRNNSTGAFELFDVSGNNASAPISLGSVGTDWSVLGFGDFSNNPGETDMLMRQNGTAKLEVYDISNNQITGAASMGAVGPEWQFLGVGDFSSNPNETDLLMRDVNNGALEVYNISHNAIVSATGMGAVGLEWQFVGVGDFSGNAGETDMLMRDVNNGALEVYNVHNDQIVSAQAMGAVGLEWSAVGIGDFSGNPGETDMIMRDVNNGAFEIYDINHDSVVSASSIGAVGTDWQTAGIAPFQSTGATTAASGSSLLISAANAAPGAQLPAPTFAASDAAPISGAGLLHA